MSIFDLTGRVAVITGGNGGIGLGIAQALNAQGCNVSIWGRNADKNKSAAATMSAGPGKVAYPHLRRHRSRLRQGRDEGDARHLRPGRRLLCQCRHRRRRTARLHRPHRGGMAAHVRDQSRRRVPCVPGRRAPHDRARRGRRQVRPAGRDLEPGLAVRHRAQRALCRHQGRAQRAVPRARASNWRATASPRMRSCPAGSRAT